MAELDEITGAIIDESMRLHRTIGPGLFESVYQQILVDSIQRRGLRVEQNIGVSFEYEGRLFRNGLRVDLLAEEFVVVELKAVERLAPVHGQQLLTYLRLMRLPVGLLINFGGATLREGLKRVVNGLAAQSSPSLRVNQKFIVPASSAPPREERR
jgi:iron complex transport system substrate-binding protein